VNGIVGGAWTLLLVKKPLPKENRVSVSVVVHAVPNRRLIISCHNNNNNINICFYFHLIKLSYLNGIDVIE